MSTYESLHMTKMHLRHVAAIVALLLLGAHPASGQMTGILESPNGPISGVGSFQGWVFTSAPGATIETDVELYIDDVRVGTAPCCSERNDVKQAFPQAPSRTGFTATRNFGLVGAGAKTAKVIARDTAGNSLTLQQEIEVVPIAAPETFIREIDLSQASCNAFQGNPSLSNVFVETVNGRFFCKGGIELEYNRATNSFQISQGCDKLFSEGCEDVSGEYSLEIDSDCLNEEVTLNSVTIVQTGCELTLTSSDFTQPGSALLVGELLQQLDITVKAAANGTAQPARFFQESGSGSTFRPDSGFGSFVFASASGGKCSSVEDFNFLTFRRKN